MATNRWLAKDSDGMLSLKRNFASSRQMFGKYLFHELISEIRTGEHYVYRIYIVGFERQPLSYKLSFYKPAKQWQVLNVSFASGFTESMDKQAESRIVK